MDLDYLSCFWSEEYPILVIEVGGGRFLVKGGIVVDSIESKSSRSLDRFPN